MVLKVLKKDHPSPEEIARFQKEYFLTKKLAIDGVIHVYGIEKHLNTLVMILEDFGGECLAKYLSSKKLDLPYFCNWLYALLQF